MDYDDPDMTRDYVFTADYREYIQGVLSWGRRRDASSDVAVQTAAYVDLPIKLQWSD